jgi:hypothetical protein
MRNKIIEAGLAAAEECGSYQLVTSVMIAKRLSCTSQNIRYYFNRPALHDAIVSRALSVDNKAVLQQAKLAGHPMVGGK